MQRKNCLIAVYSCDGHHHRSRLGRLPRAAGHVQISTEKADLNLIQRGTYLAEYISQYESRAGLQEKFPLLCTG